MIEKREERDKDTDDEVESGEGALVDKPHELLFFRETLLAVVSPKHRSPGVTRKLLPADWLG